MANKFTAYKSAELGEWVIDEIDGAKLIERFAYGSDSKSAKVDAKTMTAEAIADETANEAFEVRRWCGEV